MAADTALPDWQRAHGAPLGTAVIRQRPEDFVVEEILEVDFSDDGEFDWLRVEKRGETTEAAARILARHAGVPARQIAWSGLKDRQAVTRQWFSVHLPGRPPVDWTTLDSPSLTVLETVRHRRKLRSGTHRRNRFHLTLRELACDTDAIEARLQALQKEGVPNYFGEQRFGARGDNVAMAAQWFAGKAGRVSRFRRGIYLSAARAFLFNRILSTRVERRCWNRGLEGDVFALRDSASLFTDALTDDIKVRLESGVIHPTGSLYGTPSGLQPAAQAAALEGEVFATEPLLCRGLEEKRVAADRRPLRVMPQAMNWEKTGADVLSLSFELPKGCFATALVRELANHQVAEK